MAFGSTRFVAAPSVLENQYELDRLASVDMPIPEDASSCANVDIWKVRNYSFKWRVEMDLRQISGSVGLRLERTNGSKRKETLVLDAHENIQIVKIEQENKALKYEQKKYCSFGDKLSIFEVVPDKDVLIQYKTSGEPAVNWLSKEQTLGGLEAMCYSMGQACMNRGLFPCQDCPKARATWDINFIFDTNKYQVACGAPRLSDTGFAMTEQTVPSYLMATFVIGRIEYRNVSPRSAVWAEPELIDAAEKEFSECLELYLQAGEDLFGPYLWGRYDIILMPKAFAYGGMENPTLTFLSPTLVVGDGSLTDTIAHEIAHSWFGNLVTNETWSQFYLNEGFTMFAQRCITTKVHGPAFTALEAQVGRSLLADAVRDLPGPATRLHVAIGHDVDPDDTYNDVPYEKGYALVKYLESFVGAQQFNRWINSYLEDYAFESVNSNQMLNHFLRTFPQYGDTFDFKILLLGEGMPPYTPDFSASIELSQSADNLYNYATLEAVPSNARELFASWSTYQQAYFLDKCIAANGTPFRMPLKDPLAIAQAIGLRSTQNCELSLRWSILLLKHSLVEVMDPDVANHLRTTGKQKFVIPVYLALARAQPRCIVDQFARSIFKETQSFLDVIVASRVQTILATPISKPQPSSKTSSKNSSEPAVVENTPGEGWAGLIRAPCIGCPKC